MLTHMLSVVSLAYQIKVAVQKALGMTDAGPRPESWRSHSGSPSQIVQTIFDQLSQLISPKLILLLVEEANSGRMFLWHSELRNDGSSVVSSEEFDHSTADEYLQFMPPENWILTIREKKDQLVL